MEKKHKLGKGLGALISSNQSNNTEECLNVTNLILEIYKDLGFENVILKYSDRPDVRVGELELKMSLRILINNILLD